VVRRSVGAAAASRYHAGVVRRFASIPLLAMTIAVGAASPAAADDETAALALFRAGREAAERGDHETACKRFRESVALERAAGTLLNLGDCNERLGRLASAWRAYSEAADRLKTNDPRRDYAREKVASLEPRLARIRVELRGPTEGCTLRLDDTRLEPSVAGQPLPVDAGVHPVQLACPERAPARSDARAIDGEVVDVTLAAGAKLDEAAGPRPAGRVAAAQAPTPEKASSPLVPVGWVLGSVGLAGIGVGAVTGILTMDRKSTVDELCSADERPACPPEGLDAASEGRTFSTLSTVGFVAGAGLLATGVVLWAVGSSDAGGDGGVGASLSFLPGPEPEVVLRGRF
jgi:hypothetical protein